MKKLLIVLALLIPSNSYALVWSTPLWHVAAGSVGCADVTTSEVNTSGATFIVAVITSFGVDPAITDSKSNTWSALPYYSGTVGVKMFYSVTGGNVGIGHTFTSDGECSSIFVAGFTGNDASPYGTGTSGDTTLTPIGGFGYGVGANQEICFAGFASDGLGGTINDSFTVIDTLAYSSSNHYGGGLAYRIMVDVAIVNPTWTSTGTTVSASNFAPFSRNLNPATSGLFIRRIFQAGGH